MRKYKCHKRGQKQLGSRNLLQNHLEGAVVERVSTHHPHDLLLHYSLMGSPGEGGAKGFDTGEDPEGLG